MLATDSLDDDSRTEKDEEERERRNAGEAVTEGPGSRTGHFDERKTTVR